MLCFRKARTRKGKQCSCCAGRSSNTRSERLLRRRDNLGQSEPGCSCRSSDRNAARHVHRTYNMHMSCTASTARPVQQRAGPTWRYNISGTPRARDACNQPWSRLTCCYSDTTQRSAMLCKQFRQSETVTATCDLSPAKQWYLQRTQLRQLCARTVVAISSATLTQRIAPCPLMGPAAAV